MKNLSVILFAFLSIALLNRAEACTITPRFTYTLASSCGAPVKATLKNSSTGGNFRTARYWWKCNGVLLDSTVGLDSLKTLLQAGNNSVKLFVRDSTGCIDSSAASSINVTTGASRILDQSGVYTYTPLFYNCLQYSTDPDTFTLRITPRDSMTKVKIIWGDGTVDTASGLSAGGTMSHLFPTIGTYRIKIVSKNGTCTDTIYATLYNQRVPTAGMVGPPAGNNRGCVPHTIRLINNSYNITDNTTFTWDFGDGETYVSGSNSFADTVFHQYTKGICNATVRITARNVCGSSFTTWNPIDISDKDIARVTYDQTCDGRFPYIFHNTSVDRYCLTPDPKQYFWDFGDGTTVGWISNRDDQQHIYKKEGNYTIMLIVRNNCGDDTVYVPIKVYYTPRVGFISTSTYGCKPLAVTVTDTSKGRDITRQWTVTDKSGTTNFKDSIRTWIFKDAGTYSIRLSVTNVCGTAAKTIPVVVKDNPKAVIGNINSGCVPHKVTFSNTSTSSFGNPVYSWDFGDGTTSSVKTPAAKTYTTPGTYTVSLVITDSCNTDTVRKTFTVYGLPVAVFTGDTAGCTFDSLRFINTSSNAASYKWTFGDGTAAVVTTDTGLIKHEYTKVGTFTVVMIASSGAGCADTASQVVKIKPGAKAVFTTNRDYACAPAAFKFTNQSVYGKDFFWYVNGNLVSTAFNLPDTLLKNDTTVLNIKLYVTSASSCQGDSTMHKVFTPKDPVARIATALDSGCGPYNFTLNNTSQFAVKYDWDLGNGSTTTLKNPNATYNASLTKDTFYTTRLIAQNWAGCKDTTNSRVQVYPKPLARFTPSVSGGCGPLNVSFVNQSSPKDTGSINIMTFRWNLGNNTLSTVKDPSTSYKGSKEQDSVYTVTLNAYSEHGCLDIVSKQIRVYPDPYAGFKHAVKDGCGPLKVDFVNISDPKDTGSINIMSFKWNMGNGTNSTAKNPTAIYKEHATKDTVYNITLIAASEHGCLDTATSQVRVYPFPVARFTTNKLDGCAPLQINTTNTSIPNDTGSINIMSFRWTLSSGLTSKTRNITETLYSHPSKDTVYNITLVAISEHGCMDTLSRQVTVHPKPVAKFDLPFNSGCAPLTVPAIDQSVNADRYFWNDGNGFKPGTKNHTFAMNGLKLADSLYIVKLVVVSPYGCVSDTVDQQILVVGRPSADFITDIDSACARKPIRFSNGSLGGVKYNWNFGDGTVSKVSNPIHKYAESPASGDDESYVVQLEVVSPQGCKDTAVRRVLLVNRPLEPLTATTNTGCSDLEVGLSNPSTRFKTISWDLGDGEMSTADALVHTYVNMNNTTKMFKATLLRQRFNCYDTSAHYIYVQPKPIAALDARRLDVCNNGEHKFASLTSGNNNTFEWSINSNYASSSSAFNMILPQPDLADTTYTVLLHVKNNYGCEDSINKIVNVKPKMALRFIPSSKLSCENGNVSFKNTSRNAVRYFWDFGDGAFSNQVAPVHTYNKFGVYTIKLFGYDKDGCADSSDGKAMFEVLEKPKPDFVYSPLQPKLPDAEVTFTNLTKMLTTADPLIYEWSFGDNSTGPERFDVNPVHTYTAQGTVYVTLKAFNGVCWDKVVKPIYIDYASPVLKFDTDVKEGCMPLTVNFKNFSQNADTYRWIFGDGFESAEREPTHTYKYDGVFDVTLVITGPGGITTFTQKQLITVHPKPIADFGVSKRQLFLPNVIFKVENRSENAKRYEWSFFDTTGNEIATSNKENPAFEATEKGRYSVRLIALNEFFCADTAYRQDYLTADYQGMVYVPNVFSPNNDTKNDGFKPVMHGVVPEDYIFTIFNRWGEKLYETTDIEASWDGIYKDADCQQDVYVWIVTGRYVNTDIFEKKGTVTLLR